MIELIDLTIVPTFLLIFARLLAFIITLPIFSYRTIPIPYRIGLAFFLSLLAISHIETDLVLTQANFIVLLIKEVAVGLLIGLIGYLVLSVVQIAGGFIDFQMGFAIANVIDPQTGAQSPLIGQYSYMIAILFLLAVDGHHILINGMIHSFNVIPLESFLSFEENFGEFIVLTFNRLFVIAFQMALPLVGSLFLVDVALGIIARTVPQLNVFVVGLPLKITVSFAVLFFFMAMYIGLTKILFQTLFEIMNDLMLILGGG